MDDGVHLGKTFQDFTVNAAFRVSLRRIGVDGLSILDLWSALVVIKGYRAPANPDIGLGVSYYSTRQGPDQRK